MIISPLEQFNICPLWAFALADASSFEIIYAKLLICAWSCANIIAQAFGYTNDAVGLLETPKALILLPFKSLLVPLSALASTALVLIFYVISTFVFIYSILSGALIANMYRNALGYLESLCSGPSVLSTPLNETVVASATTPGPWYEDSVMIQLYNVYFMMTELVIAAGNFI